MGGEGLGGSGGGGDGGVPVDGRRLQGGRKTTQCTSWQCTFLQHQDSIGEGSDFPQSAASVPPLELRDIDKAATRPSTCFGSSCGGMSGERRPLSRRCRGSNRLESGSLAPKGPRRGDEKRAAAPGLHHVPWVQGPREWPKCHPGGLDQLADRSLRMREVRGSKPRFSIFAFALLLLLLRAPGLKACVDAMRLAAGQRRQAIARLPLRLPLPGGRCV